MIKLDNKLDIVLIGSENGVSDANSLANKFEDYNLLNYVSKFTFNQTTELIKHAEFIICCDGGLMHAANAVDTPIVTLLAKLDSEMQLTEANICFSLYDDLNVNNISILEILNGCKQAFNFAHNRLPNE